MRILKAMGVGILLIGVASMSMAQQEPRPWGQGADPSPDAGQCGVAAGGDRAAIMDALRAPVSADLGTAVEFVVKRARICGDWAFVIATPQKPGGEPIDWSQTTVCAGDTSHLAGGLARKDGMNWSLVDYALCPSDVAWADWPAKHKAPPELFDE
jgi:hypothetical protein